MPLKPKPAALEFDLVDEHVLQTIVGAYDIGQLAYATSLVLDGEAVVVLGERSQTSRKLVLHTDRGRFFLKRIPWYCDDLHTVEFQHQLSSYLTAAGVPVPALLVSRRGSTWIEIAGARFGLWEYVAGEPYEGTADNNDAAALTLARLHRATNSFRWEVTAPRGTLEDTVKEHVALARAKDVPDGHISRVLKAIDDYADRWGLSLPELPPVPVHGDYIPWNIAFSGDDVAAVYDFDNSCVDSRLHDVSEAVVAFFLLDYLGASSALKRPFSLQMPTERIRAFLEHYESLYPLTDPERRSLPAYVLGTWWECLLLSYIKGEQEEEDIGKLLELPALLADRWREVDDREAHS